MFRSLLAGLLVALAAVAMQSDRPLPAEELRPEKKPGDDASYRAHEWGTFTVVQDDAGRELPGVNIDDEPVPAFVHNLAPYLLNNAVLSNEHWIYRQKGAPRQHPMVTMRLETPVIYFHPGEDGKLPREVDIDVAFRGGWLTEFYPFAKASAPGLDRESFDFGPLTPRTIGRLRWDDVQLNTRARGPETSDHVWLAPRAVEAVDLTVRSEHEDGTILEQSERYIFYRGVANQVAPLSVSTDRQQNRIAIRANFQDVLPSGDATIRAAWLVEVREDGQAAYRSLGSLTATKDPTAVMTTSAASFKDEDFDVQNMHKLKATMHQQLVADGLNKDEAQAMLATWERAYFRSPGLRLFFLVPRVWTDHYLPLTIIPAAHTERVMMGRIELISTRQRNLLARLAAIKSSTPEWINEIPNGNAKVKFLAGRSDFGDLGIEIPADYQAYLALGRFRNAIVTAEARRTKSATLTRFVETYGLQPYQYAQAADRR